MITELSSPRHESALGSSGPGPRLATRLLHVRPEGGVRLRRRPAPQKRREAAEDALRGRETAPGLQRLAVVLGTSEGRTCSDGPSAATAPGRPRFEVPLALPRRSH